MNFGCTNSGCVGEPKSGQCGGCGGCCTQGELILCQDEISVLLELAQYAFLPIIQKVINGDVWYVPIPDHEEILTENFSKAIISLEQKRLITIDPDIPLSNVDYGSLEKYKNARCGSVALTLQGQEAVDWFSPSDFSK